MRALGPNLSLSPTPNITLNLAPTSPSASPPTPAPPPSIRPPPSHPSHPSPRPAPSASPSPDCTRTQPADSQERAGGRAWRAAVRHVPDHGGHRGQGGARRDDEGRRARRHEGRAAPARGPSAPRGDDETEGARRTDPDSTRDEPVDEPVDEAMMKPKGRPPFGGVLPRLPSSIRPRTPSPFGNTFPIRQHLSHRTPRRSS